MQQELRFRLESVESRRASVDYTDPACSLSKFVGNAPAIKRLARAAFAAFGRLNHDCSDFAFAICGPTSTGKTMLAKLFAETLELPYVEVQPQSLRKISDLFAAISRVCSNNKPVLELVADENGKYVLPPMIVFIDEVHNLSKYMVQSLLKATEHDDARMVTENGVEIDTSLVCWLIATTDRGDLFDAFDTRFEKISLRLYSKEEIATIIQRNNPDWDISLCLLVAKYCNHVPREALAFARDMRIENEMTNKTWEESAKAVAEDHGIDKCGMTYQRIEILTALGRRPISGSQLALVAQTKEEELRKFVIPPLLCVTQDQPVPLVTVTSRGYTITPAGISELNLRGIANFGVKAMPEQAREMFENTGNSFVMPVRN